MVNRKTDSSTRAAEQILGTPLTEAPAIGSGEAPNAAKGAANGAANAAALLGGAGGVNAPSGSADAQLAQLVRAWARLGAAFNVAPSRSTPDLERLLIETVRTGRGHARLLTMTVTWLSYYGILVARHRLARMAVERLTGEERAILAWLFEEAASHARRRPAHAEHAEHAEHAAHVEHAEHVVHAAHAAPDAPETHRSSVTIPRIAGPPATPRITVKGSGDTSLAIGTIGRTFRARELLAVCRPATTRVPVFMVDSRHPVLLRRLAERSSAIARRWNVLAGPIDRKPDALRPAAWILAHNPSLGVRGLLEGDLRASILAAIEHDPGAGASELELARRCGASRAAVRQALSRLELAGLVLRWHVGRRHAIGCCPAGPLPGLATPGAADRIGAESLDHPVGDAIDPTPSLVVGDREEPGAVAD